MDKRDLRNAICNFTGETIWGFHANLIPAATVLTVLLTRYGAGTRTVGLIAAIENSMMLVPQILGVYLFHARRGRKVRLILWHLLAMLPVILAMSLLTYAADHVPAPLFRGLMLGGFAYFLFAIGIVMAAWMDFIAHVFPIGIRGKVVGASFAGFSLAGTLGALTAGTVIRRLPAPDSFALLYLLAWLTGTVGMAAWVFVQEREAPAEHPPRPGWHELLARFRHSLGEPNFRHFLIARILATCGFCIMPFITAYYLSPAGGALPGGFVVAAFGASTVGTALGSVTLGWLGDRYGHRLGVLLGAAAQATTLLVLLVVPGRTGCLLAYAGAGVCIACGFVSHYNLVLESCPHDNRIAHISIANLLIGLPLALVPVGAGFLADASGIRTLFLVCLALTLTSLVWLLRFVRDPRWLPVSPEAATAP